MARTRAIAGQKSRVAGPPAISPLLLGWFARYTRWYLRRHAHSLRVSVNGWLPDNENGIPKVVFLNHAAWWDPLVCLHLWSSLFRSHAAYAPIDAAALEKYPFFRRLGFFGVEPGSARGAATFLRTAEDLLRQPWTMLWVTPQGRFADARERPLDFKPGLGHLAARVARGDLEGAVNRVDFIPLAIEYTYWQERQPEILLRFGAPRTVLAERGTGMDPETWTAHLEAALEQTMDALAVEAQRREPDRFLNLLAGRPGVGGIYDFWRRLKCLLRGRKFNPAHGNL